jgi:DNA-binding NtrC family response regulator
MVPKEPQRVCVLAVDDDAALLRALPLVLSDFDVVVAPTAAEAMRVLARAPVDVALVDYGLAPVNGLTLLGQIAAAYPNVRRYIVSGFHPSRFDEHVARGLVLHAFLKPVEIPVLRAVLAGAAAPPSSRSSLIT